MSNEVPDISFKEMLLVPEGPPAGVWERALEAAFAAPQQGDGPDGVSPAVAAAAAGTEPDMDMDMDMDADTDPDGGDDPDVDGPPVFELQPVPDPTFDGEEPAPPGVYPEDEVQGDGDDVAY